MRSPKTFDEFKILIHEMADRERLVFEVLNPTGKKGPEIEFYFTIRRDPDRKPQGNLYHQFRDSLGRHQEGMDKGNKRLALVTDSYLQTIYSWIKV